MNKTGTKQYWSMTEGVFNCLIDTKRSRAFISAIKKTVKSGDVVVDMGTGSGILSIAAAKAGARRVYAVEIDENNIKTLEKTFIQNNVSDKILILKGSILDVTLPEKVDVVIGEMIATALIEELQVSAMNHIHKFTKKDTRILLNKYDTFVDLVWNNSEYYGYDFPILRYEYPDEAKLKSYPYTRKFNIAHFDFNEKNNDTHIKKRINLISQKNGKINALRLSGKTTFFDGTTLGATFAYDYPLILPIKETRVLRGDNFCVDISYKVGHGIKNLAYEVVKI